MSEKENSSSNTTTVRPRPKRQNARWNNYGGKVGFAAGNAMLVRQVVSEIGGQKEMKLEVR